MLFVLTQLLTNKMLPGVLTFAQVISCCGPIRTWCVEEVKQHMMGIGSMSYDGIYDLILSV